METTFHNTIHIDIPEFLALYDLFSSSNCHVSNYDFTIIMTRMLSKLIYHITALQSVTFLQFL